MFLWSTFRKPSVTEHVDTVGMNGHRDRLLYPVVLVDYGIDHDLPQALHGISAGQRAGCRSVAERGRDVLLQQGVHGFVQKEYSVSLDDIFSFQDPVPVEESDLQECSAVDACGFCGELEGTGDCEPAVPDLPVSGEDEILSLGIHVLGYPTDYLPFDNKR